VGRSPSSVEARTAPARGGDTDEAATWLGAALLAAATLAQAQFPDTPITMIVPFPPGGVTDTVARPVAEAMGRDLKQPVVIENKPGAGGGIGMALAAKSKADGYTVLPSLASLTVLPEADKIFNREAARAAANDERVKQVLLTAGSPVQYLDAPEFQRYVDADAAKMADVVKRIGKVE
jgi:tripartite-type tricarboxylate transporter receptor subunit TctC